MGRAVSVPQSGNAASRRRHLERMQRAYRYRAPDDNEMTPIATAAKWPWLKEQYGPSWIVPFVPNYLGAQVRKRVNTARFFLQRITFRFDKLKAFDQLWWGDPPPFARDLGDDDGYDAAFGWWRVAGANAILLRTEHDLADLRDRVPLDVERVERRLADRLQRPVSLSAEANAGRLFTVDYRLLQEALRPEAPRDVRWRGKYSPAPIGVFLEAEGFYPDSAMVPLAIQIDQPQAAEVHNPVYYPDDGWGWRLAKSYLETADTSYHVPFGHVFRTHFLMTAFAMATPRQLSPNHPLFVLLRPHLRFTLATNAGAYDYLITRSKLFGEIYAGTLEETRQIAVEGYRHHSFVQMNMGADIADRGVGSTPVDYPLRDDLDLWVEPVRTFVEEYFAPFYADDAAVADDPELQAWAEELQDPQRGAVRELTPDGALDTRRKLVDLVAQVVFTAGPAHAAQHFASNDFYRFATLFPAACYQPPPGEEDQLDFARWLDTLPPISAANDQFKSNTLTRFQYDTFGHYDRFRLAKVPEAKEPIRRLQEALSDIEDTISKRNESRLFRYEFVLPSRVPNSVNI